MSDESKPVSVSILDKEYVVACTDDERDALFNSVEYLSEKMKEVRSSGKVVGSERIAVMTALNIVHEYLEFKNDKTSSTEDMADVLLRMQSKINDALNSNQANLPSV